MLGQLLVVYLLFTGVFCQVSDGVLENLRERLQISKGSFIYAAPKLLPKGEPFAVGNTAQTFTPNAASLMFFVDDAPAANWAHPCRYIFLEVEGDQEVTVFDETLPPLNIHELTVIQTPSNWPKKSKLRQEKPTQVDQTNNDTAVSTAPLDTNSLERLISQASIKYKPVIQPCGCKSSRDYAVLISGGYSAGNNWVRYWNDMSIFYKALVNVYGFKKNQIYVLMSDGTSSGLDRRHYDGTYDSSPLDLDGDGTNDVQYPADVASITTVFNLLSTILEPQHHLVIFTTDHGSPGVGGPPNVVLNLWGGGQISDAQFAVEVNKVKAQQITVVMEQCYSGGFIDNLAAPGRVIMTAAANNQLSWAMGPSYTYDEFVYYFTVAIAGQTPSGTTVNADSNNDGCVSLYEAFTYAQTHDTASETPQYSATISGSGQGSSMNGHVKGDLYSMDLPNDDGSEPGVATGIMWTSPDIWIRKTQDNVIGSRVVGSVYGHEHQHQDPVYNSLQPNYVYLAMRNRGCKASPSMLLDVYWAKASTGLSWPSHWYNYVVGSTLFGDRLLGNHFIPSVPAGQQYVLEMPWYVPNPADFVAYGADQSHFCLLARLVSSLSPPPHGSGMTFPETAYVNTNTQQNNNIVWKNIQVLRPRIIQVGTVLIRNIKRKQALLNVTVTIPPAMLDIGTFDISLPGLQSSDGVTMCEGQSDKPAPLLRVESPVITLTGLQFKGDEQRPLTVQFTKGEDVIIEDELSFDVDVVQSTNGSIGIDGGVTVHFDVAEKPKSCCVNLPNSAITWDCSQYDSLVASQGVAVAQKRCDSVWQGQACQWKDECKEDIPVSTCSCKYSPIKRECLTYCPDGVVPEYGYFCQQETLASGLIECAWKPGCLAIKSGNGWACNKLCPSKDMICELTQLGIKLQTGGVDFGFIDQYQHGDMPHGPICNCVKRPPCQPVALTDKTWTCDGECKTKYSKCKVTGAGIFFQELGYPFDKVWAYHIGQSGGLNLGPVCTCGQCVDYYNPTTGKHKCGGGCYDPKHQISWKCVLQKDLKPQPTYPDKLICGCPHKIISTAVAADSKE